MKTIGKQIVEKIEVMNSKFIAITFPLDDVNLFKEQLEEIKKEYKKAKHYCYAYRVELKSKSSDDGEPSGTAGRPLLELLHKRELNNIALVVVRYFGGTKLGASRLLRTYVQAGIAALNRAEIIERR